MNFIDLISMDDDDFYYFVSEISPDKEQLGIVDYIKTNVFSFRDLEKIINFNHEKRSDSYLIIPSKAISYSFYEENHLNNEAENILKEVRNSAILNTKKEFEYLDNLNAKYPILSKYSYNLKNLGYNSFLKEVDELNKSREKENYLSERENTKTFKSQIVLLSEFENFVNELIDKNIKSNHYLRIKPFTLFFVHKKNYVDFSNFLRFVDKNFKQEEANALIKRFISCNNEGFRYMLPRFG